MKSKFKVLICSLLVAILSLSSSMVFAMPEIDLTSTEDVNKQLETNIFLLEKDLEKRGTNVVSELKNLINSLEKQKKDATESME